ncbi:TPA: ABC transporter permease, partial [Clostridioides difficile]|nr:ABC transporter permease [Clostridioides difficile]
MLKLIQTEFLKLRRRKLIWLMLLSALIMPFFALLYFNYFGKTGVEPTKFYKWSA